MIGLIIIVFANGDVDSLLLLSFYLSFAVVAVFRKMFSFATYKACSVVFSSVLLLRVSGFLRLTTGLHLSLVLIVVIIFPSTTFTLAQFFAVVDVLATSFALAFSPTSRAMIRLSVEISSLLCFRLVAKSLYEVGSLAIMPAATTLLGIGHPRLTIIQDRSSNL
jgi:hypothetical protein